ncbi:MAG: prolipoprotein diacylglyceryl transferase [Omnitrophica bacterium RIFCSPLOWO2_12_FULL_44_17]|uniref:Phosphatidylglycerol--prolipoprotein diacylglyceryl transferase n=1 Tax=Candidatus Danuiimicrobium aquiferis TaxID=1801832 RepID=A0A1G1KS40_9BACT|nr:MAG: prolipoprotein diacylglyceryl transferase [Omnitrophica bacterium RIFCSPHIGHO2_02_FULL_45_28]OGW91234.1 MAG: prolipoprotein diacylglyceryl transferase [Omnitrophica bacterium RIFCSPHIGHO2_12_FULL_44_12]OGW95635.1 MAG: prolipoprotein diacylglyceryl transferase [Omnitrophica bacterium RIFCSPLOWO2_12_FULL_44_17]OGX03652.1 MAG: prolipoprotein diacylglyceryl transferase [Omnitrophica bacterium RIFCSPLOWO2_02_FULL_44_11]
MYPKLFSIGFLTIYSYGAAVAVGVLCAILFLRRHAKRVNLSSETMVDLAFVTIFAGFLNARIFYVVQFWKLYEANPVDMLKIWEGGLVYYGGLIGGVIGFCVYVFRKKLNIWKLLDLFVPGLAIAQGFGRIGCFLNGCCFGKSTTLPWGVQFPFPAGPVHPVQLYESAFCFVLAILLYLIWKNRSRVGFVSFVYFAGYSVFRFFIEFLRGDNEKWWLSLTVSQWISLGILFVCIPFLIYFLQIWKKK